MKIMMVASIVQGWHRGLMSVLDNRHTSGQTCWSCSKHLNQDKKRYNAWFSILYDERTLQPCGNAFSSLLRMAIRTGPHPEMHWLISWQLMLSPHCGPSATNHLNYLLVALKRYHRNWYSIVPNVLCIIQMTEILIVIDVVCEVGEYLETPSNVIL